jgi:Bardet-Biedl syndrome 9 protein
VVATMTATMTAKIVTGSFTGVLRVFLPRERGYRAEDLLMETELEGGPVLALACGRFSA